MLPRFFPAGVAVANHAESGLSLASFRSSLRLDQILSELRPGDYVLIQFGHNDQKEKGEGVGAFTTYTQSLRDYVAAIRAKGGEPVLVTSMYRRRFNDQGELFDTLGDFPAAVRKVAQETQTPLIDLHALSARLFSALGPDKSKSAFVHFPAGAYGSEKAVKDDTHFSPYGAYELARCVVEGIRQNVPSLAARLAAGVPAYDASQPDDPATFAVPPSPPREEVRIPDGDGR
jgi:lysophospholipase L1-like esterase